MLDKKVLRQFAADDPAPVVPPRHGLLHAPQVDYIVRTAVRNISDLAYGRVQRGTLDEAQDRTHRLLGIAAEDVAFLREADVDAKGLLAFRECAYARDRQELFLWRREHDVSRDVAQCLGRMTPHKFMRYMDGQYRCLFLSARSSPESRTIMEPKMI